LYDILSVAGGFGIIYRARDTRLGGHKVLIKCRRYDGEPGLFTFKTDKSREAKIDKIRDKTLFEAECLKMFKQNRESRMPILNDIEFGFSPSIYGPHTDSAGSEYTIEEDYVYDEPYIVMQVINGTNLWDVVKDGTQALCRDRGYKCYFEWERAVLEYAKELTTIFSEFHRPRRDENGNYYYIYQDLKPENIILSHDRFLTLLDFGGITKIKLKTRTDGNGRPQRFSETGSGSPGLGTFGFQAPEARNPAMLKNLDQRCDIYTLGATLFQLLTGFDMPDILATEDSQIPLGQALKGVCSEETYAVLEKCLQRDREKRYKTMAEVRADIVNKCFKDVKERIREYE
jgi:serine/threonine protein kinase